MEFLRKHRTEIRHITGVRDSGELGHPFHVVDQNVVVLPLDHPFVPEGRFASLLIRNDVHKRPPSRYHYECAAGESRAGQRSVAV